MLPSNALERALFLEADRMRAPRLTEEMKEDAARGRVYLPRQELAAVGVTA